MSIYARILGTEEPRLPVHTLSALLYELATGNATRAQLDTALALSDAEKTEATALATTYSDLLDNPTRLSRSKEIEQVLILAEETIVYTTEAAIKLRLGVI